MNCKYLSVLKKWMRCEKGVAATEFALIAPVLGGMLAGMMDYGMFLHQRMMLDILSRDAAQYVVQGGNVDEVAANVIETSGLYETTQAAGQTLTYDTAQQCECAGGVSVACDGNCGNGDYIRSFVDITVSSTYQPLIPFPGMSDDMTLTGHSRLQYNW